MLATLNTGDGCRFQGRIARFDEGQGIVTIVLKEHPPLSGRGRLCIHSPQRAAGNADTAVECVINVVVASKGRYLVGLRSTQWAGNAQLRLIGAGQEP